MYRLLKQNQNIRYYLLGGGVSRLGDVLSGMAFLFIAHDLTNSSIHTTGVAIAETLPYLMFGLVGGVIADWLPRKKLLIYLDLLRVPLIISVVVMYYTNSLQYIHLLVISFVIQTIGCFFNPAHRALLPLLTSERYRTAANSLNDTLTRGITVLSPLITVWLLHSFGTIHFFTVDALTYAISVICLLKVQVSEDKPAGEKSIKKLFSDIADFALWIYKQTTIKQLFILTFFTVFFNTWVWEVGLLLALAEIANNEEEIYSILQGVFGTVVIGTNLIIPYLIKRMTLSTYLLGACIWGTGITYYGTLYDMEHFFIGCAIVGIGLPIAGLARVYLLQSLVPAEKLGKAFSFNAVLLYFANTISLGLFGILVTFLSIRTLIICSGSIILLLSFTVLVMNPAGKTKLGRSLSINLFK
ncbi:MFS transporter [Sediminibacillus albus]|uniref:MFS-type transporter involved in bile tolerance, Atg22 family n=1 Tax=Sediminibacillus albus TaxID=407036 RepID=A0A1G8VKX0_9BACI|nr:MFS transporter [Sediminibacillus albus]SDJ65800.1 MFS-type transporter involved in bile tolerance, Atg22 family [Sediminibacillus albus]